VRVAFVYRNLNRTGSLERDSVFLLEGLAARGVELHCYCDPGTSVDVDGVVRHDIVPLTRSRSRLGFPLLRASFAARATKALRADRDRYDLIHALGVSAWEHDVIHVPAVMAAEQARWPERAGRGYRAAGAREKLAPLLRPEVAAVRTIERLQFRPGRYLHTTVVTEQVRDDLMRVHGVSADRIEVIPPAVDVARFAGAKDGRLRQELAIEPERGVLLFIGHSFERKGLADAVAALARSGTDAHLVVVGEGNSGTYRRKADELGVGGRVHFTGPVDSPEDYYAAADLLVLPTRSDPWGIPVIEAMAAGVPVVTTAAAGSASVAERAGAAVLVPARSPERLAAAIGELLADPDRRREMGERGQAEAGRFDISSVVDATLDVYERSLAEKRA
jgi:UDP-glucose:(heptosyl)LPS alpha-1,3-glucosyltransferase